MAVVHIGPLVEERATSGDVRSPVHRNEEAMCTLGLRSVRRFYTCVEARVQSRPIVRDSPSLSCEVKVKCGVPL